MRFSARAGLAPDLTDEVIRGQAGDAKRDDVAVEVGHPRSGRVRGEALQESEHEPGGRGHALAELDYPVALLLQESSAGIHLSEFTFVIYDGSQADLQVCNQDHEIQLPY